MNQNPNKNNNQIGNSVESKVSKFLNVKDGRATNRKITTTQLRNLLSNAVIIKNKIDMEKLTKELGNNTDSLSPEITNEIKYLLIKHIYQCGRDNNVKDFDKEFGIRSEIEKTIKLNSGKEYAKFYRYLEEIVAYMKYYE